MKNSKEKKSIVKTFLTKEQRAKFKALCAKPTKDSVEGSTMQAALEDYIIDCLNQKELL